MTTEIRVTERRGLNDDEVARSRAEKGENVLPRVKRRSFLSAFLSNLGDPVIRILLCALGVNVLFLFRDGDWFETAGIAVSVFTAALISTLSERGSERAYARLEENGVAVRCRVRRAGEIREIPVSEVVTGDLVLLAAGEEVPADGVLVSGEVGLDMSAMTGEGAEARKSPVGPGTPEGNGETLTPESDSAVLRGCLVTSGRGEMRVLAVGGATLLGSISREVQTQTRDSPLKVRLSRLAGQISRLGYAAAAAVALAYLFNAFVLDSAWLPAVILMKLKNVRFVLSHLLNALTLGLTVIVVAVPEGLPMMIAVVLSANVRRMVRDGVLVKKPVGIEAAGSMNILFCDKTGTLTAGRMAVTGMLTAEGGADGLSSLCRLSPELGRAYLMNAVFNTSAAAGEDGTVSGGSPTDRAILASAAGELKRHPLTGVRAGRTIPFDSARKFSAAEIVAPGGRFWLYMGAAEILLPRVTDALGCGAGKPRYSAAAFRRRLDAACGTGARAVVLARWDGTVPPRENEVPGGLCLLCAVLLRDPLRPTAAGAVAELKRAGVHVVMVTGDSPRTAGAVARECGILDGGSDTILESRELARLTDGELEELLPRLAVIARALPSDKSRLVRAAQNAGMVTGMTGDGINDAPALRAADVGFAMGSGTAVAKDAGDVVILDNDTKSIANAVLYGRTVFKSIRKFITLQLTMNFCAVGVSMIGPFIGIDAPVTVVQMLWINIIMDTLGGLAFAGEAPLPSYMKERPKRRDEPILNRYMADQIAALGIFTVAVSLAFLKLPFFVCRFRPDADRLCHLTGFFAFFIFAGIFNCFNARTDRLRLLTGLGKNHAFIGIMTAVAAAQIALVYLGGSALRTVPLTLAELSFSLLCAACVFPAELVRKLLRRLRGRRDGF